MYALKSKLLWLESTDGLLTTKRVKAKRFPTKVEAEATLTQYRVEYPSTRLKVVRW